METKTKTTKKTKWALDPAHSELMFKVKHMMIAHVKGEFRKFQAEINGEDFTKSPVHVTIDASSVFTNEETRDMHLKSTDFFDVENYRELSFEGTSVQKTGEDHYKLKGLLTIREITKEVTLDVVFGGVAKDPWGNTKAGFSVEGKINRKDWGLNWNAALESGGILVGDEVTINAEVQFIKKAA